MGFLRRKEVSRSSSSSSNRPSNQLPRSLSVFQLIPIGVGTTIGAGIYVLIGTVAREHSGPSLALSFLIAGIAAALSALCYAELASRCPSAGSAYHYSYICVGEGVAWLIGWVLILEYTVGGSVVARGIAPNLGIFFGGENKLPWPFNLQQIPGTDIIVDPCAAILLIFVTILLCIGIKESAIVQATVTYVNICVLLFVIIAGSIIGFQTGWPGYELSTGYFPFGFSGMLSGVATVFLAYLGFDAVASTAEEVKNPQRDLPLGIGSAVLICSSLYILVSTVIVGIVPYYLINVNTPIASAFQNQGMSWAMYLITTGALAALSSTLIGSLLPQPRILMAMSRDGLLPPLFSKIHAVTCVPLNSTIVTGIVASAMAFFMDIEQLAGMVSVGTLSAFTTVAICILILRYAPPKEIPAQPSQLDSEASEHSDFTSHEPSVSGYLADPLINKENGMMEEKKRRKFASRSIFSVCIGIILISFSASADLLPSWLRWTLGIAGIFPFFCGLTVLTLIEQDEGRHNFGQSGGFICPLVPFLPITSMFINIYLVISLGISTWIRVAVWLLIGVAIYLLYGIKHSLLSDTAYVSAPETDDITQVSAQASV